jgi:ketosteroid isomerase-like protein
MSAVDIEAEKKKLLDTYNTWMDANSKIDVSGILVPVTDSTVFYPPNQKSLSGRKKIRETYQQYEGIKFESYTHEVDRIEVSDSGDFAYLLLRASHSAVVDGDLWEEDIKGVVVWKKIGGEWKVMVDCWNKDPPKEEE